MKFQIICILSIINLALGRHTVKFSARHKDTSPESAQAHDALKRLLQFYRNQNPGSAGSSAEGQDSRELEAPGGFNPATFHIDIQGRDDMVPFAEDVPIGSIEPSLPKPSTNPSTVVHADVAIPDDSAFVIVSHQEEAPVAIPETNIAEQPVITPSPEDADNEVTTVLTTDKVIDVSTTSASAVTPQSFLDDETSQEDEDEDEDSEEHCKEGETKRLRCNNACVCVDGAFYCSKRKCSGDTVTAPNVTVPELKSGTEQTEKKPWGFKKKAPLNTTMAACSTGMTKSIDCNRCVCALGKWACTKRGCIALTFREKASYTDGVSLYNQVETLTENKDFDEDCSEGATRQIDCNQCVCHLNSWQCTSMTCGPTPPPKKPEEIIEACQKEGDVKSRGCNLCKCSRGLWICSNNNCYKFEDKDDAIPGFRTSSKITKHSQNYKPMNS